MQDETADVFVIGAGAAGLAGARYLSNAGLRTVVIEARDRIGGRIYTQVENSPDTPIELGAEFIHGKAPELFEIINEARLPFEEVTSRHWFFDGGLLIRSGDFWTKIEQLMDQLKKVDVDCSFARFLQSQPVDEETRRAKQIATRYVEGFHAADIGRIGVHGLVRANEAAKEIDGDRSFRLLGGYASVVNWLQQQAEDQGSRFYLSTVVKQLRWTEGKVEAICTTQDESRRFTAQSALVTLPLAVLKTEHRNKAAIEFIPSLPLEVQKAIDTIEVGAVIRIVLKFQDCFWEKLKLPGADQDQDLAGVGFIHYPHVPLPTWWTKLPEHQPFLVGWAGGPAANELLKKSIDDVEIEAIKSVARIFRVDAAFVSTQLVHSFTHNWYEDPFSGGGYCYIPVDGLKAQETLAQPIQNALFFAGEAIASGHIGTVHGAIASGTRSAKQILKRN